MTAEVAIESGDLDGLAQFIRESGDPQPVYELALKYVELLRDRLTAETEAA